jgi:hypothetical protein
MRIEMKKLYERKFLKLKHKNRREKKNKNNFFFFISANQKSGIRTQANNAIG